MGDASRVWTHPTLGKLTHDWDGWTGEICLPSFAKFDLPAPKGRYELTIESVSSDETEPSADLVQVAESLLEFEARLAEEIPVALWDELMGEGPDSGMWWCGAAARGEISQLTGPGAPEDPDELMDLMELNGVDCQLHIDDEEPVVMFRFSAPWEEEHGGMGVLVDGGTVEGIGYGCDCANRFE